MVRLYVLMRRPGDHDVALDQNERGALIAGSWIEGDSLHVCFYRARRNQLFARFEIEFVQPLEIRAIFFRARQYVNRPAASITGVLLIPALRTTFRSFRLVISVTGAGLIPAISSVKLHIHSGGPLLSASNTYTLSFMVAT
jgi:hypothetical protein